MNLRAAAVLLAVAATPEIQHFHYERAVVPAQNAAAAGQTCVVPDPTLFAHAAAGLGDARLYSGTTEVPYVVREAEPATAGQKELPALNTGVRDGQITFDATMPEGRYSDVELDVKAENFLATVKVSGSQTETSAATKVGSYTIFDLTSQKLGRSTVLHLPESDFRYLHFAISGPVTAGEIRGLTVERMTEGDQPFVTVAETDKAAQKPGESVMEFAVPAHVPVDRVEFVPGPEPANFSRDVTVKVTRAAARGSVDEDDVPQAESSEGNVLRLHGTHDGRRIDEERLTVDAPRLDSDEAGTRWTVTVENGDDPPLDLKSVRLEMAERKLCWEAAAGAQYTLFYGDAALAAPRYDYATLFTPEKHAALAELGPERANPEYQPRPDTRPFTERHPWLLWVGLVLVVLVLGAVAVRTAKESGAAG